jgi:serine/threonine protein kinase
LANTPEGVVLKVLDFGISKEVSSPLHSTTRISRTSLTSAGDPVGSPYYMAPEQMRASPDVDARADIWSLGAILFELLTGQCPFEGETMTEVCGKVLAESPPSLGTFANGTATELDAVIARCLEKDPNRRYQTVGEFAQALRAWRPSKDVELPAPEPSRRRSMRLPLAVVGLSALLLLSGFGVWRTRDSAASLESRRVEPMIAAAATPIWRALPQPEPTDVPVRSNVHPLSYPAVFQPAVSKAIPAAARAEVEPVAISRKEPIAQSAPPPSADVTDDAGDSAVPVSVIDPVSGRYGL